jgi:signal transduction histidine kinase
MHRLRDPRLTDAFIAVALAVVLQLQLALGEHDGNAVLNVAGGLLLTLPLALRRSKPVEVAGIFAATAALTSVLGGGLFTGEPPPFACLVAGAVTFYSLGAHAEDRATQRGAALGVAGLWVSVVGSDHSDVQSFLFSGGLIVATPWLVGRSSRARAQRLALLEQEAQQRERAAVGEERARIARELHDVVAHSVGGMVAQAQGARAMLDRDPERAREALEAIERTGRHALDEMRRSLGVLRRSDADAPLAPQPGIGDVRNLVEEARASGLDVELRTEGEPAPLPAGVDLSAYRIVQEALTNARKHAGPVRARVAVRYATGVIELEIENDANSAAARKAVAGGAQEPLGAANGREGGRGANGGDDGRGARGARGPAGAAAPGPRGVAGAAANGGQGLLGMRERVALYGGELHAGTRPEGGFVVRASLPIEP